MLLNQQLGILSAITIINKLIIRKRRRLTSPKISDKLNLGGPETGNGGRQKKPKSLRRDADQTQGPRQKARLIKPSKFWVVPVTGWKSKGNLGSRKNDSIAYAGMLEEPKNFLDF
jgi:hypothetical protein